MVAPSGRSKGCRTCLRRKVKCDEGRPICSRCVNGGFECGGYRQTRFIYEQPQSIKQLERNNDEETTRRSKITQKTTPSTCFSNLSSIKEYESQRLKRALAIPLSPSSIPNYESIFTMYASENLVSGVPLQILHGRVTTTSEELAITRQCTLALATIFFGIRHNSHEVLQQGLQSYGKSLKSVNSILRSPAIEMPTEIMGGIAALALCECLVPTNATSWAHHMLGLESLFARYGSRDQLSESTIAFLELTRPLMIMASCFVMKPSMMARPEWKAVPFLSDDFTNIPDFAYLLDVFAECPGLYAEREQLRFQTPVDPNCMVNIANTIDKVLTLLEALQKWRRQWLRAHQEEIFEALPLANIPSRESPNWNTVIYFKEMNIAHVNSLYNSVFILIGQLLHSLYRLVGEQQLPDTTSMASLEARKQFPPSYLLELSQSTELAAIEICRSVDYYILYCLDKEKRVELLCPLHIAWRRLGEGKTNVGRWVEDAFHEIHQKIGPGLWSDIGSTKRLGPCGVHAFRLAD